MCAPGDAASGAAGDSAAVAVAAAERWWSTAAPGDPDAAAPAVSNGAGDANPEAHKIELLPAAFQGSCENTIEARAELARDRVCTLNPLAETPGCRYIRSESRDAAMRPNCLNR